MIFMSLACNCQTGVATMVKQVTLSGEQLFDLYKKFGLKEVDDQITFLNSIYKKSDGQESHTEESEIDYRVLLGACKRYYP